MEHYALERLGEQKVELVVSRVQAGAAESSHGRCSPAAPGQLGPTLTALPYSALSTPTAASSKARLWPDYLTHAKRLDYRLWLLWLLWLHALPAPVRDSLLPPPAELSWRVRLHSQALHRGVASEMRKRPCRCPIRAGSSLDPVLLVAAALT